MVLCPTVNCTSSLTQDTVSKSRNVGVQDYPGDTSVSGLQIVAVMCKAYWINVFRKGKGISLFEINRIINCVLFLYLDLMFTFYINSSLLLCCLWFSKLVGP